MSAMDAAPMRLRLWIAGGHPNSLRALENLQALLAAHRDRVHLEVLDVFEHPHDALEDEVLVTPTLIRLLPAPRRRIVGNLSETALVSGTLGLDAPAADAQQRPTEAQQRLAETPR